MTVTGSNLVNTSVNGQPTDNEDRPFSFAIGTQIFLNPSDDPTDAVITFKTDPGLIAGTLASGISNLALGLATDAELNQISSWTQAHVDASSSNLYAVGFGRLVTATDKVGVNIQGSQVATIARPKDASSVDTADNSFVINGH